MKSLKLIKATLCYILFIVLINSLFSHAPSMTAFGQQLSPADLVVGLIYVLRDFSQREIGHKVFIAMFIGTVISYLLADPTVALASVAAFTVGEITDWSIFTFTGKPLSQRILWSAAISSPLDSIVFLAMIGRLHWFECSIMILVKWVGVLLLWSLWRQRSRETVKPLHSEDLNHA